MKKGLGICVGLVLLFASNSCIVEHRDDEYGRHREEFREHEEHRDGNRDRDYDERRDREEQRDYDDRR